MRPDIVALFYLDCYCMWAVPKAYGGSVVLSLM